MRSLKFLCVKPECLHKTPHYINVRCIHCGTKIKSGIIYGPFIVLACSECFINKILPRLPDEMTLNRSFNAISVKDSEFGGK